MQYYINNETQQKITILIAEDHVMMREAWTMILNNDPRFQVIGDAQTAEKAIELVQTMKPHVILLDINLPGMSGIEAMPSLKSFSPDSAILGISLHSQPSYARKMMDNGAMGYLTKNSPIKELFKAVVEVSKGNKYICDEIKTILSDIVIGGKNKESGINSLSHREVEVIEHIRNGYSSKEIAGLLNISPKTIEVHRYNIMKKLNLRNVASLVDYFNRYQLELEERYAG